MNDLNPDQISKCQLYNWISQTLVITAITLGKIAIIAFIQQIEGVSMNPNNRRFLYFVGASSAAVSAVMIAILWIQCSPTQKLWNNNISGSCNLRRLNELFGYFAGSMR